MWQSVSGLSFKSSAASLPWVALGQALPTGLISVVLLPGSFWRSHSCWGASPIESTDGATSIEGIDILPSGRVPFDAIDAGDCLSVATRQMMSRGVRRLLVRRDGRSVGILTAGDNQ